MMAGLAEVGLRADLRAERERVVRPLAPPEPALAVIPAAVPPDPALGEAASHLMTAYRP